MGWLHAAPVSKSARDKDKDAVARIDSFGDGHIQRVLPPADQYIIESFSAFGSGKSTGMSLTPMDWSDIAAFKQCSTFDLEPWQCELLILMSRTYCVWLNKGKEMDCFSPWDSENPRDIARHQEYLAKKLKERRKTQ